MPVNKTVASAQIALNAHDDALGLEPEALPSVKVWHFLTSLIEYCKFYGVDFDEQLSEARIEMSNLL